MEKGQITTACVGDDSDAHSLAQGAVGAETGRDRQGRVYFKAWDERDHHCLAIRYDPRVGLDRVSFKVEFEDDLDDLARQRLDTGLDLGDIDHAGSVSP